MRAALKGLPPEAPSADQPERVLHAVQDAMERTGTGEALSGREALVAAAWAARSARSREEASEAAKTVRAAVEAALIEEGMSA